MCWAKKCCFIIPLELAGVVIGIGNLIFAVITAAVATSLLLIQKYYERDHVDGHFLQHKFAFEISKAIIEITIITALVISLVWMLFSSFLILGVRKNIPSLVLSYFVYGVIMTIICFLAALFELLGHLWFIALIITAFCLINIHFLVVIHTVYELMCRGKIFGENNHRLMDEEEFLET